MRCANVLPMVVSVLVSSNAIRAQAPAVSPGQPVAINVGDGARSFSTASARGTFVALHVIPEASAEQLAAPLKVLAADFATLAGVHQVILLGGTPEKVAAVVAAAPSRLQKAIYHDADGRAAGTLGVPAQCTAKGGESCHAIILLNEEGKEVYRAVSTPASSHASFGALMKKVAEVTRDSHRTEANLDRGLALQGCDPVSYIEDQSAVAGTKSLESMYRGISYRFASAEHRDTFNANPSKYVPAYGGWCATAMAKGDKVEVDPKNFKVTGGRLFLFYKGIFGNALSDWKKDEKGLTAKADERWKRLTPGK
jgi:YHS domain-containing protein